ncbi:conjugal transfer protein TraG N-terminal domain-containing protein [Thorsellia kenyensis]|uniref:Conjugal transfer protein TraG N-terminal domain-containing protein n=1 Tax=Thorsellia kenyensis TaxID=1549888 RepID=A0ABV6CD92_9GAMM
MWEVDSIGDGAFLAKILQAVALVTQLSDFMTLGKIGLVIGVLLLGFQAILNINSGIDFKQLFVAWLVFSLTFGARTTVIINDKYTAEARVIDNVPMGVGAAGAIISKVGGGLTKLFEQAFATPAMTDYGFASTLEALAKVRQQFMNNQVLAKLGQMDGTEMLDSWKNYIKECTLIGIDIGQIDKHYLQSHPDVIEALRFESSVYGTLIYVKGKELALDCQQAYHELKNMTQSQFIPRLRELLNVANRGSVTESQERILREALNQLGQDSTSLQMYIAGAVLLPIYEDAVVEKYQDEQAFNAAAMVNLAILQRNTQWSAEQTLFLNIVRPMMTFFEGFIFAITPIMGFVLCLGVIGLKMVGKYLLILLWIQLWLPLLAIINLYIHSSINQQMSQLSTINGLQVSSFTGLQHLDGLLQTWLSTGGMLASSVPAISLMLVYGTSISATHLAGRLQSSDTLNEKMIAPDLNQISPVASHASLYQASELSGMAKTGSAQLLSQFTSDSGINYIESAAKEDSIQATTRFSEQLGHSVSQNIGESLSYQSLSSFGESMSNAYGRSHGIVQEIAQDMSKRYGFGQESQAAVQGLVSGVLAGGISIGQGGVKNSALGNSEKVNPLSLVTKNKLGFNVNGDISSKATSTTSAQQNQSSQSFTSDLQKLSENEALRAEYLNTLSQDLIQQSSEGVTSSFATNQQNILLKAAERMNSASNKYSSIKQANHAFKSQKHTDGLTLSKQAMNNTALISYLDGYMNEHPQAANRMRELLPIYQNLLTDDEQAYFAASFEALSQSTNSHIGERNNDKNAAHQLMALATHSPIPAFEDQNYHGTKEVRQFDAMAQKAESQLKTIQSPFNQAFLEEKKEEFSQKREAFQNNSINNDNQHKDNSRQFYQEQDSQFQEKKTKMWETEINNPALSSQNAARFFNVIQDMKKTPSNYAKALMNASTYVAEDYKKYRDRALNEPSERGFLHRASVATEASFNGFKAAYNAGKEFKNPLAAYKNSFNQDSSNLESIGFGAKTEAIIAGVKGAVMENKMNEYLDKYREDFKLEAYQEGINMGLSPIQSKIFAYSFTESLANRLLLSDDNLMKKEEIQNLRQQLIEERGAYDGASIQKVDDEISRLFNASLAGDFAKNELIPLRALNSKD